MKKIAVLLVVAFVLGVLLSACQSSSKSTCPAYGEHQQYQRESVY